MRKELLTPEVDQSRIVVARVDEVRLDERHARAGVEQELRHLLGVELAAFDQRGAPFDGEAFEPGLDGHTARGAEQIELLAGPQVDASLYAEEHISPEERLEQIFSR